MIENPARLDALICSQVSTSRSGCLCSDQGFSAFSDWSTARSANGVGFSEEVDFRKTASLGLQLVCTLTEQLKGTIELDRNGGTAFTMTFAAGPEQGRDSDHG